MNLIIFGASGRVGNNVLRKALRDGHVVTAYTRKKEKICFEHPDLHVYQGDVLNKYEVSDAIEGHDAVFSALGADDISKPIRMLSEGMRNITDAMRAHGIKRFLAVTGAGILLHKSGQLRGESELPAFLQYVFADQLRAYELLSATDLDYTLICSTFMPEGAETGKFRTAVDYLPEDPQPVTVGDVSAFAYKVLMNNEHLRTRIGIAS